MESGSFLDLASAEYNALHRYCNSMAQISHSAIPRSHPSQAPSITHAPVSSTQEFYSSIDLSTMFAQQCLSPYSPSYKDNDKLLQESMEEYYDAIDSLRTCHAQLVQFISEQELWYNQKQVEEHIQQQPILGWMKDHCELSGRVLTTCASSSTSRGFGPFYENGLLKDLNGKDDSMNQSWHQVRILSLATLQANITKIRKNLLEIYGEKSV
jgi:hypothetical protein